MTRSISARTRWPSPAPDAAAAALAELAALTTDGGRPGEWVDRGTCRDSRDDVHFPTGREGSTGYRLSAALAKRECAACPVLAECLAYALDVEEPHGVWGGTTPGERDLIRARRDRDQRRAS